MLHNELLLRLTELVRSRFEPEVQAWNPSSPLNDWPSDIAHPSLIESYLWLEFGVILGCFPHVQAKDVAIEFHFPVFHWLEFSIDKFPAIVRIRMERVRRNKSYFDQLEQPANDKQNIVFWDAYQVLEAMSSRFNHNRSFWYLYRELPKVDENTFKNYETSHPKYPENFWNQQKFADWEGDQNSSSILTLVKGFLTSLEYMATQQKIIVDLRELPDPYDECMAFVRKLEEIERWKLNFKESLIFEEKFLRLASIVGNHIAEEAELAGIDGERASAEFKDHVNNLVTFWKDKGAPAPQSFRVSATRSAGAGA